MRRTMLVLTAVAVSIVAWFLLARWLPGGSERFYLLLPPAALAVYLAAVPDGGKKVRSQLVPGLIYVGVLAILCTLYNLYLEATLALDGRGIVFRGLSVKQIVLPVYFLGAVSLLVIVPLRVLRGFFGWLDERSFGPLDTAQRGALPRRLFREVGPALLILPLLLPYFMGVSYVHRFKVTNTSNPRQVLNRAYEDVAFETTDGMTIRGWFIPSEKRSERTLIICHGLGANRSNFLQYCAVGDELGANVLMFDFRGHGDSDGHTVSFGYREKLDVLAALEFMRAQKPEQAREVYGLGISMGSSGLILAAAEAQPPFDGVIVDSAFASAIELTDNVLADVPDGLRPYLATFGVPIASLHAGCPLSDVRPIDAISRISSPILLIHAKDDRLIPVSNAERLRRMAAGPKDVLITNTGGHGSSFSDRKMYCAFIKKIQTMQSPAIAR